MVVYHHQLDGHEFEWTPGVGDGPGSLECCSPSGRKESDMTEQLNRTDYNLKAQKSNVLSGSSGVRAHHSNRSKFFEDRY